MAEAIMSRAFSLVMTHFNKVRFETCPERICGEPAESSRRIGFDFRESKGGGFEIGFDWVCFHQMSNTVFSHNPLIYLILHPFDFFPNWLCFAKNKLDL